MSEYIFRYANGFGWKPGKYERTNDQDHYGTLHEEIVRCRDCKHATISTLGFCKYCEMWVLPDVDGYGCDSQVNLPLDFFCAYGERKEGSDE